MGSDKRIPNRYMMDIRIKRRTKSLVVTMNKYCILKPKAGLVQQPMAKTTIPNPQSAYRIC